MKEYWEGIVRKRKEIEMEKRKWIQSKHEFINEFINSQTTFKKRKLNVWGCGNGSVGKHTCYSTMRT